MNQYSPICELYLSDASNNEENGRMKRENSDDHTHFFCSTKFFLPSQRQQEGYDGPVSLHWLICEIHSYQTLHYLGIGLKHKTPYKD